MKRVSKVDRALWALVVGLTCGLAAAQSQAGGRPQLAPGQSNWEPADDRGDRGLSTDDLCDATTAKDLVDTLLDPQPINVVTVNWAFNGRNEVAAGDRDCVAGGTFSGGGTNVHPDVLSGPVGFPVGVILSSGDIASVYTGAYPNCNTHSCITTNNGEPGDNDLNNMGGTSCTSLTTKDRAALEFDIMSIDINRELTFKYVFASEEYNEWVDTGFNDAAAIFVSNPGVIPASDENRARFPGCHNYRVCVNSINNGRHASYYQDNTGNPPARETEMDGLTNRSDVMHSWSVTLLAGQWYHVKLVVADTRDRMCDSNLFIKGLVEESSNLGSCCIPDDVYTCVDHIPEADCDALGGTWAAGTVCGELPCGGLTGACCDPDGTCVDDQLVTECFAAGGAYAGDTTTCGAVGACCSADQACLMTTQECCGLLVDGGFWSEGTCAETDCIPTGNCCTDDYVCMEDTTAAECAAAGGEYQGNFTLCVPGGCQGTDRVPAVTDWGIIVLVLLVLAAGTVIIKRASAVR